jgi:hypothetical protein
MGKVLQLLVVATIVAMTVGSAWAQLSTAAKKPRAPAPLLAASVPAFIALGAGAGVGRAVRRRKGTNQQKSESE